MDTDQLILAYEDLDPDEKAKADEILAARPDLRARLEILQQRERGAADPVPGDCDAVGDHPVLSPVEEAQQQASLRTVRRSAGVVTAARWWTRKSLILPLAAVLALVALFPLLEGNSNYLGPLMLSQVDLDDGGHRSGTLNRGSGTFRSGQAISLDFRVHKESRVFVFHVDPQGRIDIVHRPDPADAPTPGGSQLSFPLPGGGDLWVLGGDTGRETFIVAAVDQRTIDGDAVADHVGRLASQTGDHAAMVDNLLGRLAGPGIQVEQVSFLHVD
jgi:hypothetical protein